MSGRTVCAWCQKDLGECPGLAEGLTSHSICVPCRDKALEELHPVKCPTCQSTAWTPGVPAWCVCIDTGNGYTRHEWFSFGPGSAMDEAQAEVAARIWAAIDRKRAYPRSRLIDIRREGVQESRIAAG